MSFAFPGRIDGRLVADEAFGEAYDALSPEERAHIKTAIARFAVVHGPPRDMSGATARRVRQGFTLFEAVRPATWALVMWDAEYAGPTRILAAVLPAMLAGVQNILACRVSPDGGGLSVSALAALELAGQELAAPLNPEEALAVLEECRKADPSGRLVLLGGASYCDSLARAALDGAVPVRRMASPVRIGVASPSLDDAAARFAHPDAVFADAANNGGTPFSAVLCAGDDVQNHLGHVPLVLTPENGAYWAWPDLEPEFFLEKSLGVSGPEYSGE